MAGELLKTFRGRTALLFALRVAEWCWILCAGAGAAGSDRETYTDLDSCIPDAGIGFEASFQLRTYRFCIFSGNVAQALKEECEAEGRVSVKSYF